MNSSEFYMNRSTVNNIGKRQKLMKRPVLKQGEKDLN